MPGSSSDASWLREHIRDIPDFPKAGVVFKDITPLLENVRAFRYTIDSLADRLQEQANAATINRVVGIEARGFILAAPVAYKLGAAFVPVRKPGKLPSEVERQEYELEYGTDRLEIHRDAVHHGDRVAIVDDVLATGGTAGAVVRLVRRLGGDVTGVGCLIELGFLGGRGKLENVERVDVFGLLRYD